MNKSTESSQELDLPGGWKLQDKFYEGDGFEYWHANKNELKINIESVVMRLDYSYLNNKNDDWQKKFLESSFEKLAQILAKNFNFLPEPLIFKYVDSPIVEAKEPILLLKQLKGKEINFNLNNNDIKNYNYLLSLTKRISYMLLNLHKNDVIVREIPRKSIIRSLTGGFYFFQFKSFINLNSYDGYDKTKKVLKPNKIYSAPEVFSSQNNLNCSTDIYAMGKFLLQLLLGDKIFNEYFKKNPFPSKEEYEAILRNISIENEIKKMILQCISYNPSSRFDDFIKFINMLEEIDIYN